MAQVTERTPAGEHAGSHESTAALVRQATDQISRLVRDEMALARAEMTAKGKQAGLGAGLLGGGGLFSLYAMAAFVTAAILALALVVPGWAAALIVGGILVALAGLMALVGQGRLKRGVPPVPKETAQRVRFDIDDLLERMHR